MRALGKAANLPVAVRVRVHGHGNVLGSVRTPSGKESAPTPPITNPRANMVRVVSTGGASTMANPRADMVRVVSTVSVPAPRVKALAAVLHVPTISHRMPGKARTCVQAPTGKRYNQIPGPSQYRKRGASSHTVQGQSTRRRSVRDDPPFVRRGTADAAGKSSSPHLVALSCQSSPSPLRNGRKVKGCTGSPKAGACSKPRLGR